MPSGIERFDAHQLNAWLKSHGCVLARQTGSHQFWTTLDGQVIGSTDPAGGKHPVTTVMAERIAAQFKMTLAEFRKEMGVGHLNASKMTRLRSTQPQAIYAVDQVDVLARKGMTTVALIFKSGLCRTASHDERAELAGHLRRVEDWRERQETKRVKRVKSRAAK